MLRKLEELLSNSRSQRLYKARLVKLDAVTGFRSASLTLANGMTVPIGKSYRSATLQLLQDGRHLAAQGKSRTTPGPQ